VDLTNEDRAQDAPLPADPTGKESSQVADADAMPAEREPRFEYFRLCDGTGEVQS